MQIPLAVIAAIAISYYAVTGVVAGTKKVIHGVKHVAAKVIHPHRHDVDVSKSIDLRGGK